MGDIHNFTARNIERRMININIEIKQNIRMSISQLINVVVGIV